MGMKRIIVCGAAGRDLHNFNVLYRNDPDTRVVAFTAAQIPHIERGRVVYAGIDYAAILREAEQEADVLQSRLLQ